MAFNKLHHLIILLSSCSILYVSTTQPRSDCQTTFGNINFPLGTTPDCYLNRRYFIRCSDTTNYTAYLPVIDISLRGQIRILVLIDYTCFDESGEWNYRRGSDLYHLTSYSVSNTMNTFTVIGCATLGMGQGSSTRLDRNYSTGCITRCDSVADVTDGTCLGVGCYQASIPESVTDFNISVNSAWNYSTVVGFSPCSYAFLVENGYYNFAAGDLTNMDRGEKRVVLDWAVGNSNCSEAQTDESSYACRAANSECIDSINTPGYNCNCKQGFEGNPYLTDGCRDVDEYRLTPKLCREGYECRNLAGNYTCGCLEGYGEVDETSCQEINAKGSPLLPISLGVSMGLLLLVFVKRKLGKQREYFFGQNGGFILKQQIHICFHMIAMVFTQASHKIHLLIFVFTFTLVAKFCTPVAFQPRSDCRTTCGNLTIPFPFGTSSGCYLNRVFFINCSTTTNTSYLRRGNIPVLNISLDGHISVSVRMAFTCSNISRSTTLPIILSSFTVSSTLNWFTVVGCSTLAITRITSMGINYVTGCAAVCESPETVVNGSCLGIGCCQSSIPKAVSYFGMINISTVGRSVVGFNSCSYAFVVEKGFYNFSSVDLWNLRRKWSDNMPVALDWAVGNSNCDQARTDLSSYACIAAHSECINSTNGQGYNCNCTQGYQGNPYLIDGCEDVDECSQTLNPCRNGYNCRNTVGNHTCSCPEGYEEVNGTSCRKKGPPLLHISIGVSMGFLLLVIITSCIFWKLHKRKLAKQRAHFFDQNGGNILKQQQLSNHQGSKLARIFSAEDLKVATNNYDEDRVIGQGGFGTVYKGVLSGGVEIAIKKSKISDKSQVEQFINEVVILSQINHRNVVRLLGCCLETEVPLLVYEFIKNGTLSEHIHDKIRADSLSWETRLRIAVEAAGALSYLHSEASTPIVHRDIKSTNILLDENYIAKVADFGASRLIPLDQSQLATLVLGTLGYMDPEYLRTSQLTEKSDVYSFGVLLAELMTGEAVISSDRDEKYRNLAMYFVSLVNEKRLHEILDHNLIKGVNIDHIYEVGTLVKMCLMVKGEERPTMRDVSIELEGLLISITKHE